MITAGDIRKHLARLDGCTFTDRQELENALLPLFGPFQAGMPGLTFRDLADLLFSKNWATRDRTNGSCLIKFPPETKFVVDPHKLAPGNPHKPLAGGMSEPEEKYRVPTLGELGPLSYREIALLVHLHSNELSRPDLGFDSLISKGLVHRVNETEPMDTDERQSVKRNIDAGKTQAVTAIMTDNFQKACEVCDELRDANRYLNSTDFVYRLTDTGKSFMEDQPDSKIE